MPESISRETSLEHNEAEWVTRAIALEGDIKTPTSDFGDLYAIARERPKETRYTQSQILISPTP